jgi:hypothetical protein
MRLPRGFKFMIQYVAPVYLAIVIGMSCYQDLPGKFRQMREDNVVFLSMLVILAVLVFLLILINVAEKRWDARLQSEASGAPRRGAIPAVQEAAR